MAREGEHNAQLKVTGDTKSGDKELRQLASRMNQVEQQTTKNNVAFGKMSAATKKVETDITKMGQETMAMRGRLLGMATAVVGVALAIDKWSEHTVDLAKQQGISNGLAFEWARMVESMKSEVNSYALALNALPGAMRTVADELGLLDEATDATTEATEEGIDGWTMYAASFGPWGLAAKEAIGLLGDLADAVTNLSLKVAKPGLKQGMDNLIGFARVQQSQGLIKIMDRQNAEFERSVEMLEANAKAAEIVQDHLDKPRKKSARRQEATKFGEAFEFTPAAIDEMQGGRAADREKLRENQEKFIEDHIDFRQRQLDAELEYEMQRLAMRQEYDEYREPWERLDPKEAVALEEEAQIEHIEGMKRLTSDKVELQRLENQAELVHHNAHMKRIELQRQAELRRLATMREVASATNQILQGGIATAGMAADMFIESERRREKARYAAGAVSALVTGIEQQVLAIAAFAGFNYVQGALHQAAAIFAFAQAGMLGAKAGGIGGGAGGQRGLSAGFGGAANTGPNTAANGPEGGGKSEGLQSQIQSDVPPSQAPTARGPTSGGPQQGAQTLVFNGPINNYGIPNRDFVDSITRAQQQRSYNTRRVGG